MESIINIFARFPGSAGEQRRPSACYIAAVLSTERFAGGLLPAQAPCHASPLVPSHPQKQKISGGDLYAGLPP